MIKVIAITLLVLIGLLCLVLCIAVGKLEREQERELEGTNIPGPTTIPKTPKRRDEE